MAHLLGSEYCLKSLSTDARDLNLIAQELISRVGSLPVMSWKFPDKKACELDFSYLLQQYSFCMEEPESNQVSHIVLLELIIDRYNLLLQVLSTFILNHLPAEESQSSGQTHASNSLGLVAKKFWNRMCQISLLVRQLTDEGKLNQMRLQHQKHQPQAPQQTQQPPHPQQDPSTSSPTKSLTPKVPKASQTVETAFVPCESCAEVQAGFNRVGSALSGLCERERLPSAVKLYRAQLAATSDWLSASDLIRWSSELEKDASRLSKHFNQVADASVELKRVNAELTNTVEQLRSRIDKFDKEKLVEAEKAAQQRNQLEAKMASVEEAQKATTSQLTAANKALEASKRQLMTEIDSARKSIAEQEKLIGVLGRVKEQLRHVLTREDLNLEDLEAAVGSVGERLSDLGDQLVRAKEASEASATKCDNLARQNQSLQAKHRMALDRVAELSAENEQLKEAVDELEEFKDNQQARAGDAEANRELERQLVSAKMQIKESELLIKTLSEAQESLTVSVQRLKSQVQDLQESLEKSEDEKRILVEFPDLNGPINPDLQGTGDPLQDMQKQVEANETRIRLLTDQTAGMRRALEKVRHKGILQLPPIVSGKPPSGQQLVTAPPPQQQQQQHPPPSRQIAWQHQQQQQQQPDAEHPAREAESRNHEGDECNSDSDSSSQPLGLGPHVRQTSARRTSDPVPLWQLRAQQQHLQNQQQQYQTQQQYNQQQQADESFAADRRGSAGRPNSAASRSSSASGRPPNSHSSNNNSGSSIQAYKRAKAAVAAAAATGTSSATNLTAWSASPRKEIVYPCAKCNKSFKLKSDLAMHKNYCSGKT